MEKKKVLSKRFLWFFLGWGWVGDLIFGPTRLHGLCFYCSLHCFLLLMNHPKMANSGSDMNIPAFPIATKTSIKNMSKPINDREVNQG